MRATCGRKVADRKTTEEQIDLLGLKEIRWVVNSEWSKIVSKYAEEE